MSYDVSLPLVKGAGGCSSGHGKHLVSCPVWHILWNIPLGTPCTPPSPRALGSPHEARIDI